MFQDNPKIELKRVQMLSSMKTPEEVKQEALKTGFRVAGPDEQIQVAIFRNAAPEKPSEFTELTLQDVAEMTDDEVYQLSMPRPLHPEQRGFMWPGIDVANGKIKTEAMAALIKRLGNIRSAQKGKK